MTATVDKVHDIDVETDTKHELQWEDYIGQDHTFEAEVDGQTKLKPTEKDTSEWPDQPPVLYYTNPNPNGNGKVKQDVYGLCFKNMPEDMSWKKFWKYAGVDRKRVCGAMRVGKTDIIVFFKNSNQAAQCLAEAKDKNLDDVESDDDDGNNDENKNNLINNGSNKNGSGAAGAGGKGGDGTWWLDRDAKRAQFIDRMIVPDVKAWYQAFAYANRVLNDPNDKDRLLYLPITEDTNKHTTISTLFDGSLLCDLLNKVMPYFIDSRTIHRPLNNDARLAEPIQAWRIRENEQLLLSSCKAMGLPLESYTSAHQMWFEPKTHVILVTDIINKLAHRHLSNFVSLRKLPELSQLAIGDELKDNDSLKSVQSNEWINRWLNFHNGVNNLSANIQDEDFGNALFEALKKIDPTFLNNVNSATYDMYDTPEAACDEMINYAKNTLNIDTNITSKDFMDNNRQLMDLFAAQIMNTKNGLPKLDDNDGNNGGKGKIKMPDANTDMSDDSVLSWINALVPPNFRINNLERDLSDGLVLLHLLDRIQPGVVKWRGNVKKKIRTKFDKIGNCHYAIDLCTKKFPFKIVGIAGTDIVDGNQKFIHTLLWQIMRYHATQQLAKLNFGGKDVKDENIIEWANNTIMKKTNAQSTKIKNFRDIQLTSVVFYLEILEIIEPQSIRSDLINFVPPLKNLSNVIDSTTDEYFEKRLENARYAMSLIRRLGGELFVVPEDLIRCESKAVLSVLVALMTIDCLEEKYHTHHRDDQQIMDKATGVLQGGKNGKNSQKGFNG